MCNISVRHEEGTQYKHGRNSYNYDDLILHFLISFQVAVLDIDICGPSQPKMLGVENEQVHQSGSGWSPVVSDNVCYNGFLLS